MFKPMSTTEALSASEPHKVLLYAHHGFGKTYQCRYFQQRYGKGLILSGEKGLKSVGDVNLDFVPFTSWDGVHDAAQATYSFKGLMRDINSAAFKAMGYKWIAIDSLSELSDRLHEYLSEKFPGEKDTFKLWGEYDKLITASLKWIRDQPYHVYVTALAKEEKDDQERIQFWPSVKGQRASKQIPAIFDHVLCGVRATETDPKTGQVAVKRFIITEEVNGWHGKTRDPGRKLKPVEACSDITELLSRMQS